MSTSELLRRARAERGWSLAEVGRQVGVTGEAVRKWERGRLPDRGTLQALDDLFEYDGMLLGAGGYRPVDQPGASLHAELVSLIQLVAEISAQLLVVDEAIRTEARHLKAGQIATAKLLRDTRQEILDRLPPQTLEPRDPPRPRRRR